LRSDASVCVLAFAWKTDPDWPLVLAGNRDERHDRLTAPLGRWPEDTRVLAGRDLVAGGTWLGVSERGVLATVTNLRSGGGFREGLASRGWLVRDVLLGEGPYSAPNEGMLAGFNPFNLLVFGADGADFWTNLPRPGLCRLPPAIYGLANGGLDDPEPRTDRLKAGLAAWMNHGGDLDQLAELLADRTAQGDGSSIFLTNPVWGTRCSTVVRVAADGHGEILERRFGPEGEPTGETREAFVWEGRVIG
jgi:uncharacterized protein with NRDE domain